MNRELFDASSFPLCVFFISGSLNSSVLQLTGAALFWLILFTIYFERFAIQGIQLLVVTNIAPSHTTSSYSSLFVICSHGTFWCNGKISGYSSNNSLSSMSVSISVYEFKVARRIE